MAGGFGVTHTWIRRSYVFSGSFGICFWFSLVVRYLGILRRP